LLAAALAATLGPALPCRGHGGGVLVQTLGERLVVGWDDERGGTAQFDVRTFTSLLPLSLASDAPSFLSLSSPPAGVEPLPPQADLYWDFLPMTIGSATANLFYWDGAGSVPADVDFEPMDQPGVTLALYGRNFAVASVDGSPTMVAGKVLDKTLAEGNVLRLHAHRFFLLDDGDGLAHTAPAEGLYLAALQLRMAGFGASDPLFIVAATPGVSLTALDAAARSWVLARQDELVVSGDYNFDGAVDGADLLAWQRQFQSQGPWPHDDAYPDGTRDGLVDELDFTWWSSRFATSPAPPASAVPEPTAWAIAWAGACCAGSRRGRR
jgi:hypothetical protein